MADAALYDEAKEDEWKVGLAPGARFCEECTLQLITGAKRRPGRPALDPEAGELPPRSVRLGPAEEAKVLRVQREMQERVRAAGGVRTVSFSEALRHAVRLADV